MWPFSSRVRRRRLNRWLAGKDEPAGALRLSSMERDDLVWQARQKLEKGAYQDALALFELALVLWPKTGKDQTLIGKAAALQSLGRLEAADATYSAYLEEFPESQYARINRAEVQILLGRKDQAAADLKQALLELEGCEDGVILVERAKLLLTSAQNTASAARL